ncbi:MAG: hypothetical protein QE265_00065 [Rhodoferax sp.]|nr:hypothetical protein [Rhodoferax sp.]
MRVVLLILLIALAPLRGMATELMATRMAATLAMDMSASAAASDTHPSGHHCEEMALAAHHTAQPATTLASHDGCENCSLCQMCASAALPSEWHVALPSVSPHVQLPPRADRFASAWSALAQKPPIS